MGYFKKHLQFLILLILGLTAFIRGVFFLDPDFGWHLRMGELILKKGIPLIDPFSYTMPSYHFIDHEWLANILISIGFKTIGIYGLALVFALIFIAALFLVIPKQFKNYSFLPLTLAGGLMLGFTGIRTQVITWFFLSLLFKIVFNDKLWKKWRIFIPLAFVFWANLHAGFAVGIAVLCLVFILRWIQDKKFEWQSFFVFLASIAVTFINPYGIGIWHEVWMVTSDNFARWNIAEWVPGVFNTDIAFLTLFAFSFALLFRYKARIGDLLVLTYLFLLLMALSSTRHIPLWALSAVMLTVKGTKLLIDEIYKNKYAILRFKKVVRVLAIAVCLVLSFEIIISIIGSFNFSEQSYYPVKAVEYLNKQNLAGGNLFTLYSYGGYLIWKLPNQKVFIDGRMTSWRRRGNYKGESNYAFKDYLKMLADKNYFKQMVKKYNIHYILLSIQPLNHQNSPFAVKLSKLLQKFVLWKTNEEAISGDLTKMNFKKIYNDGHFVIYKI